jgi:hypothetical protein
LLMVKTSSGNSPRIVSIKPRRSVTVRLPPVKFFFPHQDRISSLVARADGEAIN